MDTIDLARLATYADVAQMLGVSVKTLRRLVAAGDIPSPLRFGRRILRWRVDVIQAWLDKKNETIVNT